MKYSCRERLDINGVEIFSRPIEYDLEQINWLDQHCTRRQYIKSLDKEIFIFENENTFYRVSVMYKG